MPLPFSHIVYADKILQTKLKNRKINKQEYFIGSVFPDIRYLTKVQRGITHLNFKNSKIILDEIKQEKNSFELGILAHLYVDYKFLEVWSEYLNKNQNHYYSILYLMDNLLFDNFKKIKLISKYFNNTLKVEEKKYSLNNKIIEKWHQIIQKFISQKINKKDFMQTVKIMGFDENFVNKITQEVKKIKGNKKIIQKIKNCSKEL